MTSRNLRQLPAAKPLTGSELLYGVQNGASVKVAVSSVVKASNDKAAEAAASAAAAATSEANSAASAAAALASKNAAATSEANTLASKNAAATSEANALASKNAAATSEANALIYKNAAAASESTSTTQATVATNQASLSQQFSLSTIAAASQASFAATASLGIVQQDLSGVDRATLHRSPNAITAAILYDTSADTDGGAWRERVDGTSWMQETLTPGNWLPNTQALDTTKGFQAELEARVAFATFGSELVSNGTFSDGTTTGWVSGSGATLSVVNGRIRVTDTGNNFGKAIYTATTTVGKFYVVRVEKATTGTVAGQYLIGSASNNLNSITNNGPSGGMVFVANATTTYISLQAQSGLYADYDNISLKEVTSFTTKSGDYYQLSTDGKFYKLSKNLFKNSVCAGATGALGSYPSGWGITGTSANAASAVTEVVNGVSTGVIRIRRITTSVNIEGIQQTLGTSLGTTPYGISLLVRVPTGVTAQSLVHWDGVNTNLIVSGTTLNAQPKDTWVAYTANVTPLATRTVSGFSCMGGNAGDGFDIAMPSTEIGPVTSYEATDTQEVFRGNTAKFPRMAAIVAETGNITIYDLLSSGRPMWMRFVCGTLLNWQSGPMLTPASGLSSVAALNGRLVAGIANIDGGLTEIDFIKDSAYKRISAQTFGGSFMGTIAQRNAVRGFQYGGGAGIVVGAIVHSYVNSISMTARPNSPLDQVTGLPIPTIAVACGSAGAGGVSVIKDDGTVVTGTGTQATLDFYGVSFSSYMLVAHRGSNGSGYWFALADSLVASFPMTLVSNGELTGGASNNGVAKAIVTDKCGVARASNFSMDGLRIARLNPSVVTSSVAARITNTFNTGYMAGDVRRVLHTDAVAGTITGAELLTNGTFTDSTGWAVPSGGVAYWSVSGGALQVNSPDTQAAYFDHNGTYATLESGKWYAIEFDYTFTSGSSSAVQVSLKGNFNTTAIGTTSGRKRLYIQAGTSTAGYGIRFAVFSAAVGSIDNVSLKEVIADRSIKSMGSAVNGTLTKTAVASAAQLVAFGGFNDDPIKELITNGTFATDLSNWTNGLPLRGSGVWSAGTIVITNSTGQGGFARYTQGIPTTIGRSYTITAGTASGLGPAMAVATVADGTGSYSQTSADPKKLVFTAKTATTYVVLLVASAVDGAQATFDNISVVATDAIGSVANLSQEAYSADLDPGTGAFTLSAWVSIPANTYGPSNFIRNSTFTGDVVTDSGISNGSGSGITITQGSFGTDAATGFRYVDFSITGTSAAAASVYVAFSGGGSRATASIGSVMTASSYLALVSGTIPAGATVVTELVDHDSSGTSVASTSSDFLNLTSNLQRVSVTRTALAANTASMGMRPIRLNVNAAGVVVNCTIRLAMPQMERGSVVRPIISTTGTAFNGIAPIIDRSGASGAYYRMGVDGNGMLAAEVFDGTTTKRITSTTAVNTGQFFKARVQFDSGTAVLKVNAEVSASLTYTPLLTLNNSNAYLTIGNNYSLNSYFPGSIAMVKIGMSIPTDDQARWMYSQERAMFQPAALVAFPDSSALVSLDYDSQSGRLCVSTATFETCFNGLVRVYTNLGTFSGVAGLVSKSGHSLSSISGGVNVITPSINMKEEFLRQAEYSAAVAKEQRVFDYDAIAAQTDFVLPLGWTAVEVLSAGALKREGSTKDYTRLYDGFRETIRFAVAPGAAVWVQITARKS